MRNNWQKKVIWQGTQFSWVDKSLPGTAGKFTYFLSSVCAGKVSTDVQQDVIIPEVTQCNPPMNIISNYSADKKSITLNWTAPNSSLPVTRYEVRDWLKRVTWQGSALSWVDHSLPGQAGNFIYFLDAVCDTKTSTMIQKNVNIQ